mgnify:CR=1 FL=1
MPKVEISASKGLVQSSGEGMHIIGGTLADSVGIHTLQELVTIPQANLEMPSDNGDSTGIGLSKKLPANSRVLDASITLVQRPTVGAKIDLFLKLASTIEAYDAPAGGAVFFNGALSLGTAADKPVGDTIVKQNQAVTTNVIPVFAHGAANNAANVTGDAKLLVTIVYAGKGEPEDV